MTIGYLVAGVLVGWAMGSSRLSDAGRLVVSFAGLFVAVMVDAWGRTQ